MTNQLQKSVKDLVQDFFYYLNDKEKDVIERRFCLRRGQAKKQTLDSIGRKYAITRERVRQIESIALGKLQRLVSDEDTKKIHDIVVQVVQSCGGLVEEEILISKVIQEFDSVTEKDGDSLKLAIRFCPRLRRQGQNQFLRSFWTLSDVGVLTVSQLQQDIVQALNTDQQIKSVEELSQMLPQWKAPMIESCLSIYRNFLQKDDKWGLIEWRYINPRSIKDRIVLAFEELDRPMHFTEVVNQVLKSLKGKKSVTSQAVHNELIRQSEFALVGRGVYGLKKWGLAAGTISDLIKQVFKDANGAPLSRSQIISLVQKKREVKEGTISLNLQKYACFKRIGRAMYEYDKSLEVTPQKRGRKPFKKEA